MMIGYVILLINRRERDMPKHLTNLQKGMSLANIESVLRNGSIRIFFE